MGYRLPCGQGSAQLHQCRSRLEEDAPTPESEAIKRAYLTLSSIRNDDLRVETVTAWLEANPASVPVLGLVMGLGQERLKNVLKSRFDASGWATLARTRGRELVEWLDSEFNLATVLSIQRAQTYDFGDILIARAGTRATASRAGVSGRKVEGEIEAVAGGLGLRYRTRTRFTGRNGQTAPCDLIVTDTVAEIVVAAKGFDSTGSKLTDAVREIQETARDPQAHPIRDGRRRWHRLEVAHC